MKRLPYGFATPAILLVLGLIVGVGITFAYFQLKSKPAPQPQPTTTTQTTSQPSPTSKVTPTASLDQTANWKIYTNTKLNFSVKYPTTTSKFNENWYYEEGGVGQVVRFGTPSSKSGGLIWAINAYDKGYSNLENLISIPGSQFKDRKEARQDITVDGIPAKLVTLTTKEFKDWIHKGIYFEKDGKIYEITNGSVDQPEFELFYKSFKFNDS
jgi:hypothetical protein